MKGFLSISLVVLMPIATVGCAGWSLSQGEAGTSGATTPVRANADLLPPFELEGWQLDTPNDPLKTYYQPNLYLHLKDRADFYLDYGFRQLTLAVYRFTLLGEPAVTVELYRMESPTEAHGIFSVERNRADGAAKFGGGAHQGEKQLDFWKGNYFVRIKLTGKVDKPAETLGRFAKIMDERIDGTTDVAYLTLFPVDKRTPAGDSYFVKDLLGCGPLGAGYTVEYDLDGGKATMFLSTRSDDAEIAYIKLRKMLTKSADVPAILPGPWRHGCNATHPTLGRGIVALQKPYVAGIFGAGEGEAAQKMLATLVEALKGD